MAPAFSCPCCWPLARFDRRRKSRVPTSTSASILPETFGGISNPVADRAIPRAVWLAEQTSSGNGQGIPRRPALQVEIGNFMQRLGPDRAVKNEWLWKGMELLGSRSSTLGETTVEEFRALGLELKKNGRFISANLLSVPIRRSAARSLRDQDGVAGAFRPRLPGRLYRARGPESLLEKWSGLPLGESIRKRPEMVARVEGEM